MKKSDRAPAFHALIFACALSGCGGDFSDVRDDGADYVSPQKDTALPQSQVKRPASALTASTNISPLLESDIAATVNGIKKFSDYKWIWSLESYGRVLAALQVPENGIRGTNLNDEYADLRYGKVPDPLDTTRNVLAFRANKFDPQIFGAPRSELTFSPTQAGKLPLFSDFWFGFGLNLPKWKMSDDEQIICQWHQGDGSISLSPVFAISIKSNKLLFTVRLDNNSPPSRTTTVSTVIWSSADLPTDRWSYFTFRGNVSPSNIGRPVLQMWRDGVREVNYFQYYGYNLPPHVAYIKIGHYHWIEGNTWDDRSLNRTILFRAPTLVTGIASNKYTEASIRNYVRAN